MNQNRCLLKRKLSVREEGKTLSRRWRVQWGILALYVLTGLQPPTDVAEFVWLFLWMIGLSLIWFFSYAHHRMQKVNG